MTQTLYVGGPLSTFATVSAALASLALGAFIEPIVIKVYSTAPAEVLVVPAGLLPSASNPLIIIAVGAPPQPTPFIGQQSLSGSLSLFPPPQPALVRPILTSVDVRSPFTFFDGFKMQGNVLVTADQGVVINACDVSAAQIRVVRVVPGPVTCTLSNNIVSRGSAQSGIFLQGAQGVKLYHNTVLQRHSDAAAPASPSFALECINSIVDAKNNMFAAAGPNAFCVRFGGDPTGSVFTGNFYAIFDGAHRFSFGPSAGGPFSVTDDQNLWRNTFMLGESASVIGDPVFRDRLATTPDLRVTAGSAASAAAVALAAVRNDGESHRRPTDFVTIGAFENPGVVTDAGKLRFLELLSGLSNQPVTKCVLGKSASPATLFQDYKIHPTASPADPPLFTPIPVEEVSVLGAPGREGLIIFKPAFQQTLEIYGATQDAVVDRANEVGLLGSDGALFLAKRMHSIPFDTTGFLHTQVEIPVEIV